VETEIPKHTGSELPGVTAAVRLLSKVTAKEAAPWLFALVIIAGELFVTLFNALTGMVIDVFLLITLLVLAGVIWQRESMSAADINETAGEIVIRSTPGYRFYIALSLAPIIRILSVAIPMWNLPVIYWYVVTGAPLLLTSYVIIRVAGYRPADVCLRPGRLWEQAGMGLIGVPLGWIEYQILRPASLLPGADVKMLILGAAIMIVFTGLVEEVIFRGIMLKAFDDYLGKTHSLIYVCFIFAILHIIHNSSLDVAFVFGVGLLFCFLVRRTGSLLGVTLAHGVTNVMLYLIWPLVLLH
jgi:membrane protease YdiL (CAAX protease family)